MDMALNHDDIAALLFVVPIVGLAVWIALQMCNKAGRSRWWGLFFLIPVVNIVAIWIFAFVRWPSLEPVRTDAEIRDVFE